MLPSDEMRLSASDGADRNHLAELISATNNCIISAVAGRHNVATAVKMVLRGIDG